MPKLKGFSDAVEGIDIAVFAEVHEMDRARMERENIDLAIRYGPVPGKGAPVIFDHVEPVCPVCSPAYKEGIEDAARERPVVLLHDANPWMSASDLTEEWSHWLRVRGVPWNRPVQNSFFNLAQLALRASVSGAGVALGRSLLVASYLADGRLIRICKNEPVQDFRYFILAREQVLSKNMSLLVEWIAREMNSP